MIRYAFALTLALGTVAGIAAAVEASSAKALQATAFTANQTIVEKNSPFPVIGPLVVQECAVEDCSEAQG